MKSWNFVPLKRMKITTRSKLAGVTKIATFRSAKFTNKCLLVVSPICNIFINLNVLCFFFQLPRPEETTGSYTVKKVKYNSTAEIEFLAEVETVLELKRKFKQTGQFYHVVLESQNMYNAEDRVEMTWEVSRCIPDM